MKSSVAVLLAVFSSSAAFAQSYPTKPVRLVVPFGAGGAPDLVARVISPKLGETPGQPVVVDDRAGAGGASLMLRSRRSRS